MARSITSSSRSARLRKRAERLMSKKDLTKIPSKDVKALIEELRVHQIELELQNEELRRVQDLLEMSRSKFADLYDFAPVGYFSFNRMGEDLGGEFNGCPHVEDRADFLDRKVLYGLCPARRRGFVFSLPAQNT